MKIIASVKFNDGKAYIVDNLQEMKYHRIGNNIIYGTDGIRYICYKLGSYGERWKAFGGSKFTLKIHDTGEIVECFGQWWDGGYGTLSKHLGIELVNFTYKTAENLKKCYVFTGAYVDKNKLKELLEEKGELFYYDYREYEKVLKYDDVWRKRFDVERKLERHKKSLIKQCKLLSKKLKPFKNQIFINKL